MVNFSNKTLLVLSVLAALVVVALSGCNGGSPPTNVKIAVTGQVLLLADDGTTPGQAGVTVTLTNGAHVFSAVTGAGGTYNLTDVLAPMTYAVTIAGTGVKTSTLSDVAVTIPSGGAGSTFTVPVIYVTPDVPAPPTL
jgi:hypothetical protein